MLVAVIILSVIAVVVSGALAFVMFTTPGAINEIFKKEEKGKIVETKEERDIFSVDTIILYNEDGSYTAIKTDKETINDIENILKANNTVEERPEVVDDQAEEETRRAEEEARAKAEEERIAREKAEEEARAKAEEEARRVEEEARVKAEEEKIAREKAEEEARQAQEAEAQEEAKEEEPVPTPVEAPISASVEEEPTIVDDEDEDEPSGLTRSEEVLKKIGTTKTFEGKMRSASDEVRGFYNTIKNTLLALGTKSRLSKKVEKYNLNGVTIAQIKATGKGITLFLDLKPSSLDNTKYVGANVGDKKAFATTPYKYPIRTNRKLKWALELIEKMKEEKGLMVNPKYKEQDYTLDFPRMSDQEMIEKGYIVLKSIK